MLNLGKTGFEEIGHFFTSAMKLFFRFTEQLENSLKLFSNQYLYTHLRWCECRLCENIFSIQSIYSKTLKVFIWIFQANFIATFTTCCRYFVWFLSQCHSNFDTYYFALFSTSMTSIGMNIYKSRWLPFTKSPRLLNNLKYNFF